MWQLNNQTPYAAAQAWIRDREGRETWVVVVKATFAVTHDGQTVLADSQPEPVRSPVYRSEPADESSLLYENDFVLGKQATDVVVLGHAYGPNGSAVRSLDVGMQLGSVRKLLKVFGNRVWRAGGGGLSVPEPFTKMPLCYERAFGGVDRGSDDPGRDWYWANPVGVGFVTSVSRTTHLRAPNVEYPGELITSWDARPRPAGLGVLASHWQERARFAGTYDKAWENDRFPLLPLDYDLRHNQAVPQDQQATGFLVGGERGAVTNMTPSGTMRFTLPTVKLLLDTRFQDGTRITNPSPRLHSVIIEPDHARISLVFHSAIECHSKVMKLTATRIRLDLPKGHKDAYVSGNLLDLL
jgi:hypothetical protein